MPDNYEITPEGHYLMKHTDETGTTYTIPIVQLLSSAFMQANTSFASFDALLGESDVEVTTKADFMELPDREKEALISRRTPFDSWGKMQEAAWARWTNKQTGP